MVDAQGRPTAVHLTPGQASELQGADALPGGIQAPVVIADTAFDADARVLDPLARAGKTAVIPPRSTRLQPRPLDQRMYAERHRIENFFAHLKQFRAIATRYDKTKRNFLAALHLASSYLCLV